MLLIVDGFHVFGEPDEYPQEVHLEAHALKRRQLFGLGQLTGKQYAL